VIAPSWRAAQAPTEALFGYIISAVSSLTLRKEARIISAVSLLTLRKEDRMGAAVLAVIARKERELVSLFTREGATSPVAAKTLQELNIDDHGIVMRRLRSRAVVREHTTADGTRRWADRSCACCLGSTRRLQVTVSGRRWAVATANGAANSAMTR
jgi:hypothetical protein